MNYTAPDSQLLLSRLENVRSSGDKNWSARCPCPDHEDRRNSLSVSIGDDGRLLVHCHAGCNTTDVVAAIGLAMKDLFPSGNGQQKKNQKPRGRFVKSYDYCDEKDSLLFQVCRTDAKDFWFQKPDGNGGWIKNIKGVRRVLYRLPELSAADPSLPIYVVEGEKDVDRLRSLGLISTCNPGGAGNWNDDFSEDLRGRSVVIVPDNDSSGRQHAEKIARNLHGKAASIRIVELPDLPDKSDVSDWLDCGGTVEQLKKLVEDTPEWEPKKIEISRDRSENSELDSWPEPLEKDAYYGLAGDFVEVIEPHSEADPVALLIQFLVAYANAVGRRPYFAAEADRHHLNLFTTMVGETSKGRKGTSWGHVFNLLHAIDSEWSEQRVMGGLSSGEGLIWAVRDPIFKREPIRDGQGKSKIIVGYEEIEVDSGESDKRLLVLEPEFASVLRVIQRESNTLSAKVRQAWDVGNLRTLVKNSPAKATGAHISIIGHITRDELRRYMTETEAGNGFGNRFLWLCVRRSKCLPEGGCIHEVDFTPLIQRLSAAVKFARTVDEMRRDEGARKIWAAVYPSLSEGKPGLLGAMISRAEAQVMRLACVYALLDLSQVVRTQHLTAAIALWQYSEASARYIFGATLGDPIADEILSALKQAKSDGLTRTEISNLFKRNRKSANVDRALRLLSEMRLAYCKREETGGRPVERWFAGSRT